MSGLLTAVAARPSLPTEQIRFATILNGGVSLAVWMGGVSVEIDRLVRGQSAYRELLAFVGSTARVDVITGTSAGGINGAALALAQANPRADLRTLRELWAEHGDIRRLLRQPFGGQPTSVLKGDEYFLPRLQDMMAVLAADPPVVPEPPPIDLSITTTVLRGNQSIGVDSMGTLLPQQIHGGRFHWSSVDPATANPFATAQLARTAEELALACRGTASFPLAFEPVFIPANRTAKPPDDRPDMSAVVTDWGDVADRPDRSRYAVDGGVLANTPTRAALAAVERMQAGTESIRRVMLLVYPHAPAPGEDKPDRAGDPPTVLETMTRLINASRSESQRTFVEELERHNEQAAGRRGTREDVITSVQGNRTALADLFRAVYPHYRHLRIWRAGRDLARRATDEAARADASALRQLRWTYEQVRLAAGSAQESWDKDAATPDLPYVPRNTPGRASVTDPWAYGVTAALGVTDTVADLLVRLLRVASTDADLQCVGTARAEVSRRRIELLRARDAVDAPWRSGEGNDVRARVNGRVLPDVAYWKLRIASYARVMTGGQQQEVEDGIAAVVAKAVPASRDQLRTDLTSLLLEDAALSSQIGLAVTEAVRAVVQQLQNVLPVLATASEEVLTRWHQLLEPSRADLDALLFTLIQVEVATTALGDEVTSGATLPLDVVQLSAATRNAFTEVTRSADDKLGGMSVQRFGGFLKRSWRMNDWIWGRVDAATMLCLTVLKPSRIRRTAELAGYLVVGATPQKLAEATVDETLAALFGPDWANSAAIGAGRAAAIAELTQVFDVRILPADLPASLPALADLFALGLHAEIVPEELPALAGAVKVDLQLGSNAQANGAIFVEQYAGLIARAERASTTPLDLKAKTDILFAFDHAGIGREPLSDEARGDALIRTATNAAAVGVTLLDSDRLGLTPIKPATRAVRGAALVPYWILTGLASQKGLMRNLAFLALALGGALLMLAVFGALPEALLVPAATIGGGAVVVVLAFGAARSGTMLHGLVLLPSGVVLTAIGIKKMIDESQEHPKILWNGAFGAGALVALLLALIVLGSLPGTNRSVGLAVRRWVSDWRRVVWTVARLVVVVLVGAGGWWLVAFLTGPEWVTGLRWAADQRGVLVGVTVGVAVVGGLVAIWLSWQLKLHRRDATEHWTLLPLSDAAGVAAGWSVVYGVGYLAVGLAIVFLRPALLTAGELWIRITVGGMTVAGLLLVLVVPWLLVGRAVWAIRGRELSRASLIGLPGTGDADLRSAYVTDLAARGAACRWHSHTNQDKSVMELTRAGGRLFARAQKASDARSR